MKRIIEIDEATFGRIDDATSVPDMIGTDIVNGLNAIKASKPFVEENQEEQNEICYKQGLHYGMNLGIAMGRFYEKHKITDRIPPELADEFNAMYEAELNRILPKKEEQ